MTQKMLHTRLYSVCGVLLLLLIAGSVLGWCMSRDALPFLALSPLVVSVPAAYLAHCFQQRALFVNSLRKLWSDAVKAKGLLVRYCLSDGQTDYYERGPDCRTWLTRCELSIGTLTRPISRWELVLLSRLWICLGNSSNWSPRLKHLHHLPRFKQTLMLLGKHFRTLSSKNSTGLNRPLSLPKRACKDPNMGRKPLWNGCLKALPESGCGGSSNSVRSWSRSGKRPLAALSRFSGHSPRWIWSSTIAPTRILNMGKLVYDSLVFSVVQEVVVTRCRTGLLYCFVFLCISARGAGMWAVDAANA